MKTCSLKVLLLRNYWYDFISQDWVKMKATKNFKMCSFFQINNSKNISVTELAYVSANDSAAVWEVNVAHKWKMLTLELATWIEDRWRLDCKKAQMKEYVHVSYNNSLYDCWGHSCGLTFIEFRLNDVNYFLSHD